MLTTGFFMGVFVATYQITADSIFLNRMGEYLDKAFLMAGILGIVSTALFSFIQSRIRFSTLTQISVALIFFFTVTVYVSASLWQPRMAIYCGIYNVLCLRSYYCYTLTFLLGNIWTLI
jgi:AAA family ATP:ADP antiporter